MISSITEWIITRELTILTKKGVMIFKMRISNLKWQKSGRKELSDKLIQTGIQESSAMVVESSALSIEQFRVNLWITIYTLRDVKKQFQLSHSIRDHRHLGKFSFDLKTWKVHLMFYSTALLKLNTSHQSLLRTFKAAGAMSSKFLTKDISHRLSKSPDVFKLSVIT